MNTNMSIQSDAVGNSTQVNQPIVYRINAAVKKLGISRATIYRMIKAGDLDLVKISIRASGITSESMHRHLNNQLSNSQ